MTPLIIRHITYYNIISIMTIIIVALCYRRFCLHPCDHAQYMSLVFYRVAQYYVCLYDKVNNSKDYSIYNIYL
jgi:hypothetical protein